MGLWIIDGGICGIMKKRVLIFGTIAVVLLGILVIWYNIPIDLLDLDSNEVVEIVVFNGNTGNATHITDRSQIVNIIENLNDIRIKRWKPSVNYMGYSFIITIYLSDGNTASGWNNFIINSGNTIRKDPFFYTVVDGSIDYDYIAGIVD